MESRITALNFREKVHEINTATSDLAVQSLSHQLDEALDELFTSMDCADQELPIQFPLRTKYVEIPKRLLPMIKYYFQFNEILKQYIFRDGYTVEFEDENVRNVRLVVEK